MTYTFLKLAEEVLEEAKKRENIQALSHVEIWEKAEKYGIQNKCSSSGKTPWQSICAQIYVDMKDNAKTIFAKIGTRPVRFALKKYVENGVKITDMEKT